MIEKYVQLKMFFDYELPLILLFIGIVVWVTIFIVARIITAWEKRQKRLAENYFKEEEEEDEQPTRSI